MSKLPRSAWLKTPYAKSTASNPDASIRAVLAKYGVLDVQWTEGTGASGRPACMLRFFFHGKPYRVALESLDAEASRAELLTQIKRAIYYQLKGALELVGVFCPAEKALFTWLELPGGQTLYEGCEPHLERLEGPPDFGRMLALPPPRKE